MYVCMYVCGSHGRTGPFYDVGDESGIGFGKWARAYVLKRMVMVGWLVGWLVVGEMGSVVDGVVREREGGRRVGGGGCGGGVR